MPRNDYNDPRNDPRYDPREAQPQQPRHRVEPSTGYRNPDPRGYDPRDQRPDPRSNARPQADDVPAVPEGEYPIKPIAHRFGAAGTNTIQIGVRVKITEGEHKGKMLIWYGSFTDDSEDMTLRAMAALGHQSDDITDCAGFYDPAVQETVSAIGVVVHERNPKNQRLVAKVKFINGGDIVMAKELTKADEERFRSRMRAALAQRNRSRGGASTLKQAAGGSPPPGNDRRPPPPRQPNASQPNDPWDEQTQSDPNGPQNW